MGVKIDFVIEIKVSEEEIVRRLSGRRIHPASGRTYHLLFNPPRVEGKDDLTGEPLVQREDDREETIRNRLKVYYQQTQPLIEYYSRWSLTDAYAPRYIQIDGLGSVEQIRDRIFAALSAQ